MHRVDKSELRDVDVHALPDILSISLWVLEYLSDENKNTFGAAEVANYMIDDLGIRTSRQAVYAALKTATAKKFTHKDKRGFKIMKLGQDEIRKQNQEEKVIFIEPGKPFKAGMKVEAILTSTNGVLKISDPYVDVKTLDVLHRCAGITKKIKLLTSQVNKETSFSNEVKKLVIEGVDIEVRKMTRGILHDRYFMDDTNFWLSGNSLNSLGKKESFIVLLGEDVRSSMHKNFDSRWQSAVQI